MTLSRFYLRELSLRRKLAVVLCDFQGIDPDALISDGGHTALDYVVQYDVDRLFAGKMTIADLIKDENDKV